MSTPVSDSETPVRADGYPAPMFEPFHADEDGFDTDVVVVGRPWAAPPRRAGHLRGAGARGDSVLGGQHPPRAHHQPARRGGAARPRRRGGPPSRPPRGTRWATPCSPPASPVRRSPGCRPGAPGDLRYGDYLQGSPCTMLDLPQPLDGTAADHQRGRPRREGLLQHRVPRPHPGRATASPSPCATGRTGTPFTQRARFLVGADGARSQIAEDIGLEIYGELARAGTVYTRFNADLTQYVAHRPSILHWIMNPPRRVRRDRHGPAPRRPAVGPVDRRLGIRPERTANPT